jgi:hypothetical protein
MTWIHRLNTPSVLNKVSIFNYNTTPQVYPQYRTAYPISLNENIFTNSETITVDGETIPLQLDFSGVIFGIRRLGDGGSVYCRPCYDLDLPECYEGYNVCQALPWPRCAAQYSYSKLSDQIGQCSGAFWSCNLYGTAVENSGGTVPECLENFGLKAPDDGLRYPSRIIKPTDIESAEYWNDMNLWFNGSFLLSGAVLLENTGPSYEDGGEEYLYRIGHSVGPPCADTTASFFDPEINEFITRVFECACKAFDVILDPPDTCDNYGIGTIIINEEPFTLFRMKKGQEPIPQRIKRYKVLVGKVKENFPTYGVSQNATVTKAIIKKNSSGSYVGRPDRNLPETYGFGTFWGITQFEDNWVMNDWIHTGGQGDDGASVFTVSNEGETLFLGFSNHKHGAARKNIGTPDLNRCNPENIFYLNDETKTVDINTWCLPNIYHPEESIPGYPDNDPLELIGFGDGSFGSITYRQNTFLRSIQKPEIATYSFGPLFIEESANLPNLSQESEFNFPLKNNPYFSRESTNSIYQNANLIDFKEKRMLQASELNELQEKFYKNQSLFIEYNKNWLSKEFLISSNIDILGTSQRDNLFNGFYRVNKIIPISKDLVSLNSRTINGVVNYEINTNEGWYMLHSKQRGVRRTEGTIDDYVNIGGNDYYDLSFIKLMNNFMLIDNSELKNLNENQYLIIVPKIDTINLISCNEYSDLKDNSNGSSTNSPCGADRNVLFDSREFLSFRVEKESGPSNLFDQPILSGSGQNNFLTRGREKSPINSLVAREIPATYVLAYCTKQQNNINVYLANGHLIGTIFAPIL